MLGVRVRVRVVEVRIRVRVAILEARVIGLYRFIRFRV